MNEVTEILLEGLKERESQIGSALIWAGKRLPCSGGAELGGKLLQAGGYRVTAAVPLVLRLAVLPDGIGRPQEKQTLSYFSVPGAAGRSLRIDSVTVLYDAVLVLECEDPRQGA